MTTPLQNLSHQLRDEIQESLDGVIDDTIREAALPNALAWIVVVGGSFAINLLLLVLVSGG
jgi:hypothetical protein